MTSQTLHTWLLKSFAATASLPVLIGEGWHSRAWQVEAAGNFFIVRVGANQEGFVKDQQAATLFDSLGVPVPKVVLLAQFDDYQWVCISNFIQGTVLSTLSAAAYMEIVPQLAAVLFNLKAIQPPADLLFGHLDQKMQAHYTTWQSWILNYERWPVSTVRSPRTEYADWKILFQKTFLEEKIARYTREALHEMARFCPEERHYVHGDFGFGNALVHAGQLTAIIDWAELQCGDFLFDPAYADYWNSDSRHADALRVLLDQGNDVPAYFTERILCYKLRTGLQSIFLYSNRGDEAEYERDKVRLRKLGVL